MSQTEITYFGKSKVIGGDDIRNSWTAYDFINLSEQGRKAGHATMKKVSRGKNGRFTKKISHHQFVKLSSKPSEHRELLRNHENRLKEIERMLNEAIKRL